MPKAAKSGSKATSGHHPEKPKNSFGVAVKKARRIRHLMLKELAERVGCSPSAISKIENDKATPSLAMVYRICKALRMNVATLLEDQSARRPVVTKAGHHSLFHTAGMQWARLIPPSADRRMGASIVEIAPDAWSDGPLAHESGEVLGLVLEGKLKLTVDDKTYSVEPGDSFTFLYDLPHTFGNASAHLTRVLFVLAPPVDFSPTSRGQR